MVVTEDIIVEAAVFQFKRFLQTDADRHMENVASLINSADDPWNCGCKVARRMGRKRASVLLDRRMVEAGCRGYFRW